MWLSRKTRDGLFWIDLDAHGPKAFRHLPFEENLLFAPEMLLTNQGALLARYLQGLTLVLLGVLGQNAVAVRQVFRYFLDPEGFVYVLDNIPLAKGLGGDKNLYFLLGSS